MAAGGLLSRAGVVSVLLDGDHVDQTQRRALQQECNAADRASADAQALCRPSDQVELPVVDLEHDAGGGGGDRNLPDPRHNPRLSAGAHALRRLLAAFTDASATLP